RRKYDHLDIGQAAPGRLRFMVRTTSDQGAGMREKTIELATADGTMTTFVVHPERGGPHPLVIFLMDAAGIREELRDMARRIASTGYYVIQPNLYHRLGVLELPPGATYDD